MTNRSLRNDKLISDFAVEGLSHCILDKGLLHPSQKEIEENKPVALSFFLSFRMDFDSLSMVKKAVICLKISIFVLPGNVDKTDCDLRNVLHPAAYILSDSDIISLQSGLRNVVQTCTGVGQSNGDCPSQQLFQHEPWDF